MALQYCAPQKKRCTRCGVQFWPGLPEVDYPPTADQLCPDCALLVLNPVDLASATQWGA